MLVLASIQGLTILQPHLRLQPPPTQPTAEPQPCHYMQQTQVVSSTLYHVCRLGVLVSVELHSVKVIPVVTHHFDIAHLPSTLILIGSTQDYPHHRGGPLYR
jgi:hypothetical protein